MKRPQSGREWLRGALRHYREVDGASFRGMFVDLVTDAYHLIHESNRRIGICDDASVTMSEISNEACSVCMGELEDAEYGRVRKIPKRKLVLHVHDKFEFESSRELFQSRLKEK